MGKRRFEGVVLRLSDREREVLKILTAALKVSEYTDDVEGSRGYRREDKMKDSMAELFTTLTGLSLIGNELPPTVKQKLGDKDIPFSALEPILAPAFEIGRRYKRVNPDKIRSEYGKMIMLLQDSQKPRLKQDLSLNLLAPVETVGSSLDRVGAGALLEDPRLLVAATQSLPVGYTAEEAQRKADAIKAAQQQFGGGDAAKEELIERCLLSIGDAMAFISINKSPIKRLLQYLAEDFADPPAQYSLAIRNGVGGSCLSHGHEDHRQYVREALTLWTIIHRDIFDFWECAESDLVSQEGRYAYSDTGQGFHRVCAAPRTYARMQSALAEARQEMGGRWVGSTIVHLGDRDVPNSLVFIDKYTIIPRLLSPVVHVMDELDELFRDDKPERQPGLRKLVLAKYPSVTDLKMSILADFFKHGFDGSGDDGGSCIDGRLTSAWNWCHQINKKPFYDAFVLTGFTGFDCNYN